MASNNCQTTESDPMQLMHLKLLQLKLTNENSYNYNSIIFNKYMFLHTISINLALNWILQLLLRSHSTFNVNQSQNHKIPSTSCSSTTYITEAANPNNHFPTLQTQTLLLQPVAIQPPSITTQTQPSSLSLYQSSITQTQHSPPSNINYPFSSHSLTPKHKILHFMILMSSYILTFRNFRNPNCLRILYHFIFKSLILTNINNFHY